MKNPDPNSNRSKKRNSRGFTSFKQSRRHKRAERRLLIACTIQGRLREPGESVQVSGKITHKAGGSRRYH